MQELVTREDGAAIASKIGQQFELFGLLKDHPDMASYIHWPNRTGVDIASVYQDIPPRQSPYASY